MAHRPKERVRCPRCRLHVERCLCSEIPTLSLATRIVLVMHHRETKTTTATGPLALAALPNHELHLHGVRDRPLNLHPLFEEDRRVLLLYPSEGARPLNRELIDQDQRPISLVVPDGNWRQASRAARRVPGLERAERVTLPTGQVTRWGLRRETKTDGLATFEAIARALGAIEGADVQARLEALFLEMVRRESATRSYRVGVDTEARGSAASMREAPRNDEEDAAGGCAPAARPPVDILYQDDTLVVVNKPSGQLVHRGWGKDGVPALQALRDHLGHYVYPVHRLDRATSGALLFARSASIVRPLQEQFNEGSVDKRYLALCRGHDAELRRIDHPLSRLPGVGELKPAVTDLSLLGSFGRYGLFEVRPRTGRAHQIRRHLKHASHPLIGDVRYGKGEHNRWFREHYGFSRLALHCHWLAFAHPVDGRRIVVHAPLANDLRALFARLELASAAEAACQ